ncbi:MAG: hypothetical protein V1873_01905 [Verrucomicrobiota bacterium]
MPHQITAVDETGQQHIISINKFPDTCPACQTSVKPQPIIGHYLSEGDHKIRVSFICPADDCKEMFIAAYNTRSTSVQNAMCNLVETTILRAANAVTFPDAVAKLSPVFCTTYNQSLVAEENGLDQIAGPGYRKSLEFLIKDFIIHYKFRSDASKAAAVAKAFLATCIEQFIDEDRIKHCAKRAAWLGNDETHYTRKWEEKDLRDLKALVNMTVNWIDLVIQSDEYLKAMPEKQGVLPGSDHRSV